mmetsp:Transcript_22451/g.42074  ORF Transcript_22451/g.42074 Transcript_22451/m.42074 type:complete len:87 (-) Transcript_22451:1332-1592(-)
MLFVFTAQEAAVGIPGLHTCNVRQMLREPRMANEASRYGGVPLVSPEDQGLAPARGHGPGPSAGRRVCWASVEASPQQTGECCALY